MDKKTATSNLFIISHLLVLFLTMVLAATQTHILGNPLIALAYYFFLVALPVLLFLRLAEHQNPWVFLRLNFRPGRGIALGLMMGAAIFGVFFAFNHYLADGIKGDGITLYLVLGTLFAGMAEELLFRGFILQRFMSQMSFIKANILSSMLFVVLHTAACVNQGGMMPKRLILLLVISLWLGYLFKRTRSLWTVMLVHALYNLTILFF